MRIWEKVMKWLAMALFAYCALCVTVHLLDRRTCKKAEHLLQVMQKIKLSSSRDEVQRALEEFQPEASCKSGECAIRITVEVDDRFGEPWFSKFAYIYFAAGGHNPAAIAILSFNARELLTYKSIELLTSTVSPVHRYDGQLGASLAESYVENTPDRYEYQFTEHPDYLFTYPTRFRQYTGGIWFTPELGDEKKASIARLRLDCFSGWKRCNTVSDILPAYRISYNEDYTYNLCRTPIRAIARDFGSETVVEVKSASRQQRPFGEAIVAKAQVIQSDSSTVPPGRVFSLVLSSDDLPPCMSLEDLLKVRRFRLFGTVPNPSRPEELEPEYSGLLRPFHTEDDAEVERGLRSNRLADRSPQH